MSATAKWQKRQKDQLSIPFSWTFWTLLRIFGEPVEVLEVTGQEMGFVFFYSVSNVLQVEHLPLFLCVQHPFIIGPQSVNPLSANALICMAASEVSLEHCFRLSPFFRHLSASFSTFTLSNCSKQSAASAREELWNWMLYTFECCKPVV